jgi:hypothetical protein
MQDTTSPVISDITVLPDPQEVEGFVNSSAIIEDNYELHGAWIDIMDPDNNPWGNFSMSYDSDTNRHYNEQAFGIVGTYQVTIWARDETNNWNFTSGQIVVHDTTLPEISDVTALPDPQEVGGLVEISTIIEDNYELYEVWINITDPEDDPAGNYSLGYDGNRYNYEQTFDIVGVYQFTIWTSDTSNNWNLSSGQFQILDTTLPIISNAKAVPNLQEVEGYVNISAFVTDNVDVDSVRVEITDPDDDLLGNFSMSYDFSTDSYSDYRVYDIIGTYQFTIWVSDTSGNWRSKSNYFTIQDTQPPVAYAGLDQTVIEGTTVTFDGSVSTDNIGIVDYSWTFTDSALQTLHGSSPIYTFDNVHNFEISLRVADEAGNSDTDTMWVNVTMVPDTIQPAITHTPITGGTAGEPLIITAEITDNIEVEYASLFYRQGSETVYTEVAMVNTQDNEWTADIPSSEITIAGIEYYIFATDGVNNATEPADDPYLVKVESDGAEEDFTFLILLIVIIAIISLILIMLFLRQRKGKPKPGIEEPVFVETL